MNWRSPRYALAISIAACLAVYGCATVATRHVHLSVPTCAGTQRGIGITVRYHPFPPAECARLAGELSGPVAAVVVALETHLACATQRGSEAIIVLPPDAPRWAISHEVSRIIAEDWRRWRVWNANMGEC